MGWRKTHRRERVREGRETDTKKMGWRKRQRREREGGSVKHTERKERQGDRKKQKG